MLITWDYESCLKGQGGVRLTKVVLTVLIASIRNKYIGLRFQQGHDLVGWIYYFSDKHLEVLQMCGLLIW